MADKNIIVIDGHKELRDIDVTYIKHILEDCNNSILAILINTKNSDYKAEALSYNKALLENMLDYKKEIILFDQKDFSNSRELLETLIGQTSENIINMKFNEKKALIDYNKIQIDESKKNIFLEDSNMIIDLGAIAKGYAADEIVKLLKNAEVSSAIIDLGGNIYVLGDKIDGTPWKVGVQNPEKSGSDTIGFVSVSNKSIVTSGVYERYFEHDGKNYHHILSPDTGYPYDNNILGVSILSNNSIDGDSLSTTLFALGVDEGLKLINSLDDVEAIFITKNHELYLTNGFKKAFTLTNNNYEIKE